MERLMAQASLVSSGWEFEVDRGPDWLFVRPRRMRGEFGNANFAEQVWSLLEQHFSHRLVLELGELEHLNSEMIGQLVWLYKRIHTHDGLLRICQLTDAQHEVLHVSHLGCYFPRFRSREDAVMGHAMPRQPR
jgi:anti-anti-sigma regulatory factor